MNNNALRHSVSQWSIFKTMLLMDVVQLRAIFWAKVIDRFMWVATVILVAGYLLPQLGIDASFGQMMLAGLMVSVGLIEAYSSIAMIVSDLDGNRSFTYFFTLPIPAYLVFVRLMVYFGLFFSALGLILFPMANFLLPQPIAYSSINWVRALLMMLISNFFNGALIVWSASFIHDMRRLGQVWSRLLQPLWFFGGFQFTWAVLHKKFYWLSYVALANPVMLATEGMRSAILGPDGFLPFWPTAATLALMTGVLLTHAIVRYKKYLDLV
jgi:hypothetical protein